jgi:hypothetical protein
MLPPVCLQTEHHKRVPDIYGTLRFKHFGGNALGGIV